MLDLSYIGASSLRNPVAPYIPTPIARTARLLSELGPLERQAKSSIPPASYASQRPYSALHQQPQISNFPASKNLFSHQGFLSLDTPRRLLGWS